MCRADSHIDSRGVMQHRQITHELMDDPSLPSDEHVRALRGLARINRWSRAAAQMWLPIAGLVREMRSDRVRVLDIGSGGGDVAIGLWQRGRRQGAALDVVGCDVSERAVAFARMQAALVDADVCFVQHDVLRDPMPDDYDVLISSLFLHHLQDDELQRFLNALANSARRMVVLCDLARSRPALALAHVATRALSRSPVVHVDGPRSVRAALSVAEIHALADAAGMRGAVIRRCWPMRFLLVWRREA
jgi:2-polyprenyl-3-methyl-5-hydroxy-6-metoxy-1,4-benzoquinol methylase